MEVHERPESDTSRLLAPMVQLGPEDLALLELELVAPEPAQWLPQVRAFGRVLTQPSAATVLRAPFRGLLLEGDVRPALGAGLEAGEVVFWLSPRYTPVELREMALRRAASENERTALETELPRLRVRAERARSLNAQDKTVSDRDLEEAEAALRVAETRLAGARELAQLLSEEPSKIPLSLPFAGEVTELDARAGEVVEAGAVLLRAEDFRTPLVSIDMPVGFEATPGCTARVDRVAGSGGFIEAQYVGLAPGTDAAGTGPALLFRVGAGQDGNELLRPGLAVTASLCLDQPAQTGLRVPAEAIVRLGGQGYVYVSRGREAFERVPLAMNRPLADGWFADADWLHGETPEIVVRGAQQLLSFELLERQAPGAEN